MWKFRQDLRSLRRCSQAAWLLAFAGAIAALSGLVVWGLLTVALAVVTAVVLDERIASAPPYLVLDEDGIRLAALNAHIPWSDIDGAALVPQRRANVRNCLAVELSETGLDEALRRAPRLKSVVRESLLHRRRLEIALPTLDAPYAECARAMAVSRSLARHR